MERAFINYLIVINIAGIIFALYDKLASMWGWQRIRERNLFALSLLGGALGIYLTMLIIRHKTRKKKFMLGLPLIILVQLALAYLKINNYF